MSTYTKEDVTFHHAHGRSRPAVNVKVRGWWRNVPLPNPEYEIDDPEFTHEWVEENVSDDALDAIFWHVCESELECLEEDAKEIFGRHVELFTEGRSGGWVVLTGINDFDDWDAIDLAKWRRFERYGHEYAKGIPGQMLLSIYLNEFLSAKEERERRAAYKAWLYRARVWAFTELRS